MTQNPNIENLEIDIIIKPSLINFHGEFFNNNIINPYELDKAGKNIKIKNKKLNNIDNKFQTNNDSEFLQEKKRIK